MVCLRIRDEFRLRMFGFSGVKAERLCYSHWRVPVALYMLYRFVAMGYCLFWLGFISQQRGFHGQAFGAYLTIWTYYLLNLYLVVHFLASAFYHLKTLMSRHSHGACSYLFRRPDPTMHANMFTELSEGAATISEYEAIPGSDCEREVEVMGASSSLLRPPWYLCLAWVLISTVSTAALMVSFVFFVFLFPNAPNYPAISLDNLQEHLLNSVVIIIEHLISAAPSRLLHIVYPFVYGLIYMSFSVIYWAGDHARVMYPILDWNKPGPTVGYVFLVGFVFIPVLHCLFFLLHKAKISVYRCLVYSEEDL